MHNTERSRLERGQVAFKLQAVHVDEAAVNQLPDTSAQCTPPQQLDETCERFSVELHTVPLEAVFLELTADVPFGSRTQLYTQQEQLHKLLQVPICSLCCMCLLCCLVPGCVLPAFGSHSLQSLPCSSQLDSSWPAVLKTWVWFFRHSGPYPCWSLRPEAPYPCFENFVLTTVELRGARHVHSVDGHQPTDPLHAASLMLLAVCVSQTAHASY